ncbi:MAG TPA: hypothetical protein VLI39_06470 [Sedimentisphaerales bacterium]|nr:hypothetical protein [Sedimentisphaerales bacterium]
MQKERLFARIGELTVRYATLEHQLQSLLDLLLAGDNQLIGPFLIHELNLAVLLRKIKHVGRYRLQDNRRLLADLEQALRRIEAIRDLRNLLMHGNWQINEDCPACPVKVRDFKMKFEGGQWQETTETTFNEKKLDQLVTRLQGMSNDVQRVTQGIQGP